MKKFFHTKSFRVLIGVVVVLLGVLIYTQSVDSSVTANIISFLSSPIQKASSSATNSVRETLFPEDEKTLADRVAELEEENREYRRQLIEFEETKKLVEQYRQMLGIREEHSDFSMVPAAIISTDSMNPFFVFTIDKGDRDGVSEGDPVVSKDGLVGWISNVYKTTSVVTTIFSEDAHIGATVVTKRETGVIESNIKLADQGYVRLSFLDTNTQISANDLVTTTGLSGNYPKDIMVGRVISVESSENGISKHAVVKPYAKIRDLEDVFVITDFEGKGEVDASELYPPESSSQTESSSSENSSDVSSLQSESSEGVRPGETGSSSGEGDSGEPNENPEE
ncbi:MAG: rod shape-determining protein MreC [Clostridia bacterium]|nr:rod shape-determining protein MreC [Clostridia bacterium]